MKNILGQGLRHSEDERISAPRKGDMSTNYWSWLKNVADSLGIQIRFSKLNLKFKNRGSKPKFDRVKGNQKTL